VRPLERSPVRPRGAPRQLAGPAPIWPAASLCA
jgi:hypothetical protein